jgi:hypothetical protein
MRRDLLVSTVWLAWPSASDSTLLRWKAQRLCSVNFMPSSLHNYLGNAIPYLLKNKETVLAALCQLELMNVICCVRM